MVACIDAEKFNQSTEQPTRFFPGPKPRSSARRRYTLLLRYVEYAVNHGRRVTLSAIVNASWVSS